MRPVLGPVVVLALIAGCGSARAVVQPAQTTPADPATALPEPGASTSSVAITLAAMTIPSITLSSTAPEPALTVHVDDGCDRSVPTSLGGPVVYPSIMTIAPGVDPISYTLTPQPQVVCPSGTVTVAIAVRNNGTTAIEVRPELILTGIFPHVFLGVADPLDLDAGGTAETSIATMIPEIPSGTYQLQIYGYSDGAEITVRHPSDP